MDIGDLRYAGAAVYQRRSDEIWQSELRFDDLRRSAFVRSAIELLGNRRGDGGHPAVSDLGNIDYCAQPELSRAAMAASSMAC